MTSSKPILQTVTALKQDLTSTDLFNKGSYTRQKRWHGSILTAAGDPGFEPGILDSESSVMPFHQSPNILTVSHYQPVENRVKPKGKRYLYSIPPESWLLNPNSPMFSGLLLLIQDWIGRENRNCSILHFEDYWRYTQVPIIDVSP